MPRLLVLALALVASPAVAFVPSHVRAAAPSLRMSETTETESMDLDLGDMNAMFEAAANDKSFDEPLTAAPAAAAAFDVKEMAGVTSFPGFFDPVGMSNGVSEARMMFYREAELKHSRVAMLAALGFLVAEGFHPLFGGSIDVPSYVAFQATPLQTFWPVTVLIVGTVEIFSVLTYQSPFDGKWWTLKESHKSGDFMFDPAGLKPTGALELKEMQTKELNNGRLAMLGIAGMVGQELATGAKLF